MSYPITGEPEPGNPGSTVAGSASPTLIEELRDALTDLDTDDYGTCTIPPEALRSLLADAIPALADSIPLSLLREHRLLMGGSALPHCDCGEEIESWHDWLTHLKEVRDHG